MSVADSIAGRIKVKAYKNIDNPDGRETLCGEKAQICSETGREYFEVPGHQKDYLEKLLTGYEFTDDYEVDKDGKMVKGEIALPKPRGRKPLPKVG